MYKCECSLNTKILRYKVTDFLTVNAVMYLICIAVFDDVALRLDAVYVKTKLFPLRKRLRICLLFI